MDKILDQSNGKNWSLVNGDCVEVVKQMPSDSVHFQLFSPPYSSLFVYSASDRDIGNCRNDEEFLQHFLFLCPELLRIGMPGRLMVIDVMELPTSKQKDGFIGLKDLPGMIKAACQKCGWIYHSRIIAWQNPVTAMQRTKALGLLHKQIKKDSCMSRQGIARELLVFRKPGENPEPVTHTNESFPVEMWQRYASPIYATVKPKQVPIMPWECEEENHIEFEDPNQSNPDKSGIDMGETLQRFRESDSEPHICPMQTDLVRRPLKLWTNPGDTVFDPFSGIGTTGYVALQEGRKFFGSELKTAYFNQAVLNLRRAETETNTPDLFSEVKDAETKVLPAVKSSDPFGAE